MGETSRRDSEMCQLKTITDQLRSRDCSTSKNSTGKEENQTEHLLPLLLSWSCHFNWLPKNLSGFVTKLAAGAAAGQWLLLLASLIRQTRVRHCLTSWSGARISNCGLKPKLSNCQTRVSLSLNTASPPDLGLRSDHRHPHHCLLWS